MHWRSLLSALTFVVARRVRRDHSRIQWLPRSSSLVLLQNTGLLTTAVLAAAFAVVAADGAFRGGFWQGDPFWQFGDSSSTALGETALIPLAVLFAVLVAYHLRSPLPNVFNVALLGGLMGLSLGVGVDWYAHLRPAICVAPVGLGVPAGFLAGAACGTLLCWLWLRRRRMIDPASSR